LKNILKLYLIDFRYSAYWAVTFLCLAGFYEYISSVSEMQKECINILIYYVERKIDNAIFEENLPLNLKNLPHPPLLLPNLNLTFQISSTIEDPTVFREIKKVLQKLGYAKLAPDPQWLPFKSMIPPRAQYERKWGKKKRRNFLKTEDVTIWARRSISFRLQDVQPCCDRNWTSMNAERREREREKERERERENRFNIRIFLFIF